MKKEIIIINETPFLWIRAGPSVFFINTTKDGPVRTHQQKSTDSENHVVIFTDPGWPIRLLTTG
jgi:hypothetical protein